MQKANIEKQEKRHKAFQVDLENQRLKNDNSETLYNKEMENKNCILEQNEELEIQISNLKMQLEALNEEHEQVKMLNEQTKCKNCNISREIERLKNGNKKTDNLNNEVFFYYNFINESS